MLLGRLGGMNPGFFQGFEAGFQAGQMQGLGGSPWAGGGPGGCCDPREMQMMRLATSL